MFPDFTPKFARELLKARREPFSFYCLDSTEIRKCAPESHSFKNNVLEVEIPGFDKKEIFLIYENSVLSVVATHKNAEGGILKRTERAFDVSYDIQEDKITATLENGVLFVTLPPVSVKTTKKIVIS